MAMELRQRKEVHMEEFKRKKGRMQCFNYIRILKIKLYKKLFLISLFFTHIINSYFECLIYPELGI